MSRINTLLAASLEAADPTALAGPSMEDYLEYRAALEEYLEASNISDKLQDLTNELVEVEAVVEESRAAGALTDDQVAIQAKAVADIRTVITGESEVISAESFASLEAASLHVSVESKGLLSRMWDGIKAMLRAIRDAFVKAWRWVTGSSKRAKDVAKDCKALADETDRIIEASQERVLKAAGAHGLVESPKVEDPVIQEIKEVASEAEETTEEVEEVNETLTQEIKAIEKATEVACGSTKKSVETLKKVSESDKPVSIPTPTAEEVERTKNFQEIHRISMVLMNAAHRGRDAVGPRSEDQLASWDLESGDKYVLSKAIHRLSDSIRNYSGHAEDLKSILSRIDHEIDAANRTFDMVAWRAGDDDKELERCTKLLLEDINNLESLRKTVVAVMQKADKAVFKTAKYNQRIRQSKKRRRR